MANIDIAKLAAAVKEITAARTRYREAAAHRMITSDEYEGQRFRIIFGSHYDTLMEAAQHVLELAEEPPAADEENYYTPERNREPITWRKKEDVPLKVTVSHEGRQSVEPRAVVKRHLEKGTFDRVYPPAAKERTETSNGHNDEL
jgi:hypothetical protein